MFFSHNVEPAMCKVATFHNMYSLINAVVASAEAYTVHAGYIPYMINVCCKNIECRLINGLQIKPDYHDVGRSIVLKYFKTYCRALAE